ncbi:hypothetical protein KCU90_g204, partial [Aureobasidium melanogenum]
MWKRVVSSRISRVCIGIIAGTVDFLLLLLLLGLVLVVLTARLLCHVASGMLRSADPSDEREHLYVNDQEVCCNSTSLEIFRQLTETRQRRLNMVLEERKKLYRERYGEDFGPISAIFGANVEANRFAIALLSHVSALDQFLLADVAQAISVSRAQAQDLDVITEFGTCESKYCWCEKHCFIVWHGKGRGENAGASFHSLCCD